MYILQTSVLLIGLLLVCTNSVWSAQSGSSDSKTNSKASSSGAGQNALQPSPRAGPMIDRPASKNVTALLGKTAYLNCKVKNLGNKTVSWVRHRDIHLLTVGRYTYTSDQRFRAIHHQSSEDWSLQIKYPQHRDTGIYECQISTTPHMSHFIHLNVVEPTTDIIGGPDLYIDRGSTINLTCVVLYSPEPPAYIFWNHNEAIISYDSPRGGVSVITEKGETTTSFLLIQRAKPTDSGRYQCNPSNAQSKSINVHVLNGNRYQQLLYPQDEGDSSENEGNDLHDEKNLQLLNEIKDLHKRIDHWEAHFERITRMEEEISEFSLRLAKLETIFANEIAEHGNDSDCNDCDIETTEWSTEGPQDVGSTDYPDVTTDSSSETSSTDMTESTPDELIEMAIDYIERTSEGAENEEESHSGSGDGIDEESDAELPHNSGNGVKFSVTLMTLASLMAQFPAAMQHGGQAHHRSSHLYCLIFCVCLLLFST